MTIGAVMNMNVERQALFNFSLAHITHDFIHEAACLASIAGHFGTAFLVVIQFFKHHHGQVKIMFLETEQAGWIVHQDIGIEYKQTF